MQKQNKNDNVKTEKIKHGFPEHGFAHFCHSGPDEIDNQMFRVGKKELKITIYIYQTNFYSC